MRTRTALVPALMLALVTTGPVALPASAVAIPAQSSSVTAAEDPLLAALKAVPGLTVVSESQPTGYRYFILSYTQPIDHRNPKKGTFQQRLSLLHRDTAAPVVLYTSGYGLSTNPSRTEPTRLLNGNQVSVEHRFFTPSRPAAADWRTLDIWQEASDEHRIVEALKTVYTGKWIQTGASKGGMTSVYHRRFYPGDVDGVVAYVAPNDRVNPADRAYDDFFATVGDAACRTALKNVQIQALKRRDRLVPRLQAYAADNGYTFTETLGTADRSFEMTVLDAPWAFWQYSRAADCADVPAATASDDEIYEWLDQVASFAFYTDQGQEYYTPYYYQAATQLGWPELKFAHLRGLLRYPGLYQANSSIPAELRSRHDPRPMLDVDHWVRKQSSRMMFIYGENDPWSAERFTPTRKDSYLYVAPGANHGANVAGLEEADRLAATTTLRRWAGVSEVTALQRNAPASVPDDDMLPARRPF
ncbi:S28 family serine protease [Planotetraspora phitsanulokensis]|uniref:Tripeptidyl aminopeptidase n=1 Tax=Planotetraspora phitsanulokensis TaxID=575192 RepID=A0A8J3U2L8_9ACTN|nr:S28 family serine protease [Planotetraspora phitsanulokensis]GII37433.1 tripeptidyl aminopeptidase [Planotetraspora phitsanulokensis]